jgi:hypothetical protein
VAFGAGLFLLLSSPARAIAQQFSEVAVGWTSIGPIPGEYGTIYRSGAIVRTSMGGAVSERLRLGATGIAVLFDSNVGRAVPCPSNGCPHPYYDRHAAATISIGGSGQLNIDARGRFYLNAGAGEYATFLGMTEFRLGVSGGAGTAVPIGTRLLATVQADFHSLFGQNAGPSHLLPLTVGLRF